MTEPVVWEVKVLEPRIPRMTACLDWEVMVWAPRIPGMTACVDWEVKVFGTEFSGIQEISIHLGSETQFGAPRSVLALSEALQPGTPL